MQQCRARAPSQKSEYSETYSVDNEQSVRLTCYSCCHRFYAERSAKKACARVAGYIMAGRMYPPPHSPSAVQYLAPQLKSPITPLEETGGRE